MPDQSQAEAPFRFRTLKPQRKPVELDDGRVLELRSPDDDAITEWHEVLPTPPKGEDGKSVPWNFTKPEMRGVVRQLVGLCLFNGEAEPVGADFVLETFQSGDITDMFMWLVRNGGLMASEDDLKN